MAHELFHCYQYDVAAHLLGKLPAWVVEGTATWVGLSYRPDDPNHRGHYASFFAVRSSLKARRRDGVGVFVALADAGVDVWPLLLPLHSQTAAGLPFPEGSDLGTRRAVSYLLDRAAGTDFAATFASRAARRPDWGRLWDITGPGVPDVPGRRTDNVALRSGPEATPRRELATDRTGDPAVFTIDLHEDAFLVEVRVLHAGDRGVVTVGAEDRVFDGPAGFVFCVSSPCTCHDGGPLPRETIVSNIPLRSLVVGYTRWPSRRPAGDGEPPPFPDVDAQMTRAWAREFLCLPPTTWTEPRFTAGYEIVAEHPRGALAPSRSHPVRDVRLVHYEFDHDSGTLRLGACRYVRREPSVWEPDPNRCRSGPLAFPRDEVDARCLGLYTVSSAEATLRGDVAHPRRTRGSPVVTDFSIEATQAWELTVDEDGCPPQVERAGSLTARPTHRSPPGDDPMFPAWD